LVLGALGHLALVWGEVLLSRADFAGSEDMDIDVVGLE
jgi:hypothetical protein